MSCGSRKLYRFNGKLISVYMVVLKTNRRFGANAPWIIFDKFHEWIARTAYSGELTAGILYECWSHGIWLQSNSRKETTSFNRQEIRGVDIVVPQRIEHALLHGTWRFASVFICPNKGDICTYISIKRQTLVGNIGIWPFCRVRIHPRPSHVETTTNWQKRNIKWLPICVSICMDYKKQINNISHLHNHTYRIKKGMSKRRPSSKRSQWKIE